MAKTKIENQIQVIERLPRLSQKDDSFFRDFIKEKVKEGLRDGFKDLMKEAFNEFLGDKQVKEIQEEIEQQRKDEEHRKEMAKWMEEFKARQEEEKHNPIINTKEAAEILGVTTCTVISLAKRGHLKVKGEKDGSFGWQFKKNEIEAFKNFLPDLIRRRRKRYARKISKSFNTDPKDPYMSPLALKEKGISPITSSILIKYIKKGYIQHKIYCATKGKIFYYVRVNHLKELLANPPDWLKKSLKLSKACSPED